ncbi:MAG: MarR family transcriptional regulator [Sphingomonadaceae bacterium]|nr:MarR family transcriptional regulator [Sphingomonadaceae bacterium]
MPQVTADANQGEVRAGHLSGLVGYHVRRASNAMVADFAEQLQDLGIRPTLFAMLSILSENPGINQGLLGRTLGIQRANMVPLVSDLMGRGLIERRDVPGDKRAFALHLTRAGAAMFEQCHDRIAAHEDRMLSRLDEAERDQLIDLLGKIDPDA